MSPKIAQFSTNRVMEAEEERDHLGEMENVKPGFGNLRVNDIAISPSETFQNSGCGG
jgi:hypothetical protein